MVSIYVRAQAMTEADSLYALYVNEAVPAVLFTPPSPPPALSLRGHDVASDLAAAARRPQWFVFGTGALTYDIYVSSLPSVLQR